MINQIFFFFFGVLLQSTGWLKLTMCISWWSSAHNHLPSSASWGLGLKGARQGELCLALRSPLSSTEALCRQAWWCTPLVPALGMKRQVDFYELQASLVFPDKPCLKIRKQNKTTTTNKQKTTKAHLSNCCFPSTASLGMAVTSASPVCFLPMQPHSLRFVLYSQISGIRSPKY